MDENMNNNQNEASGEAKSYDASDRPTSDIPANSPFDAEDIRKNKDLAIVIAVFPFLFFLPLIMDERKNSKLLKYYLNAELSLTALYVCSGIIMKILGKIPVLGWFTGLVPIAILVFHIINIIYVSSLNGQKTPIIGEITIIK